MRSAFLAMIALAAPARAEPPQRSEVPIRQVILSDGARRYAVPITIDGTPIEAGLDTGSTGLRILGRALAGPGRGGAPSHYQYSGGLAVDGVVTHVAIGIGGASGGGVAIQRIDRLGCVRTQPDCAGRRLGMADFGLQGDGLKGEGFPAILGTNMASGAVPDPLVALGARRWIVELPRPGDADPGRLILDPTDAEVAGYTRYPLIRALASINAGVHDALPGCLVRKDSGERLCAPILFDSGAPGFRLALAPRVTPWPQGTEGTLVIGDGGQPAGLAFTVGRRDQAAAMLTEPLAAGAVPHISAGLMPYFGWSVLYDPQRGEIGLKPR